jgi:hypothetical protein
VQSELRRDSEEAGYVSVRERIAHMPPRLFSLIITGTHVILSQRHTQNMKLFPASPDLDSSSVPQTAH